MKKSKSTAYMHHLLLFLVFGMCVAVLPNSSIGTFEYPKFLFLVLWTALIVSAHGVMDGGQKKKIPYRFLFPIMLFSVGHLLAFLSSVDRSVSFVGSSFRYAGIMTYLALVSLWYVSAQYFARATDDKAYVFWKWVVGSTVVVSIFAIVSPYISSELFVQSTLLQGRIFGTFGNPNYFAGVLLLVLPLAVLLPFERWIFRIGFVGILSIALLLTGSRTALFAFVLSMVPTLYVVYRRNKNKRTLLLWVGGVAGVTLCSMGVLMYAQAPLIERFSFSQRANSSLDTRMLLWQGAVPLVQHMPWTGYGHDTLALVAPQYMPEEIQANTLSYVDRMHSEPLDILLMHGPITLIGFVLLFGVCLHSPKRVSYGVSDDSPVEGIRIGICSLFLFLLINFSSLSILVLLFLMGGYITGTHMKRMSGDA